MTSASWSKQDGCAGVIKNIQSWMMGMA